jgi:hypothetical protein
MILICSFSRNCASVEPSVLLPAFSSVVKLSIMLTPYEALLGKRVEAHYRASDLQLSAAGTLVADSGKSISIEDNFVQNGREKKMRLEIPYQFIFRIVETPKSSAGLNP